jgi:hypothetical protein
MKSQGVNQFFREDGTLIAIPAKHSKKLDVLLRIAESFTFDVKYPEKEVNEVISRFNDDTAAIRRYMIEFGVMERDSTSTYWLKNQPAQD